MEDENYIYYDYIKEQLPQQVFLVHARRVMYVGINFSHLTINYNKSNVHTNDVHKTILNS